MYSLRSVAISLLGLSTLVSGIPTRRQSSNSSNPVVDLGYAQYQGISNDNLNITTYYGLQYAAPPIGSLRWQPPVPIENSTYAQSLGSNPINATTPQYQCPQGYPGWLDELLAFQVAAGIPYSLGPQIENEDCLRLDVLVPNSPQSSSLPVVVEIHGGGYTLGSSLTSPGDNFTSYSNGSIIYVQIQYRLAFLGFLGNQEVIDNGTANAGLLDQRAALGWVQRHIAAFGGDPGQVTIWGASAGGGSVSAQLQLYGGEGDPPYRGAIPEYPWFQPFHNMTTLETQYNDLLTSSNCTDLDCLRNLPSETLTKAQQAVFQLGYDNGIYGYGDFYAGPSIDNKTILELPTEAYSSNRFTKVPTLIDHEPFEGVLFTPFEINQTNQVQQSLATVWQTKDEAFFSRLFQLYPPSAFSNTSSSSDYFASDPEFFDSLSAIIPNTTDNTAFYQRQAIFGDFSIDCPTYFLSTAMSGAGQPVYKLIFAAGSQLHGATTPFLYLDNQDSGNATVAAAMKAYFINFIVNLDPNQPVGNNNSTSAAGEGLVQWPVYFNSSSSSAGNATQSSGDEDTNTNSFQILLINSTGITAVSDPDASDRCDFLGSEGYIVDN